MATILSNIQDSQPWLEAMNAKLHNNTNFDYKAHLNRLLADAGAITDQPCILFWRELVQIYPEAKVVHVERDEDSWYRSLLPLLETNYTLTARILRWTDPFWFGRISTVALRSFELSLGGTNLELTKANAKRAYRAYNAAVRATVPKGRLLVYEMGSGWAPLCSFLGKDIPDEPFPWLNESAGFQVMLRMFYRQGTTNSLFNLGVLVGVAAPIGFLVHYMAWPISWW